MNFIKTWKNSSLLVIKKCFKNWQTKVLVDADQVDDPLESIGTRVPYVRSSETDV